MIEIKDGAEEEAAAREETEETVAEETAEAKKTAAVEETTEAAEEAATEEAEEAAEESEKATETAEAAEEAAREECDAEAECECAGEKKERKLGWTKKAGAQAKKAKQDEQEKVKRQIAEANDKYVRLLSEFDNFRKRSEKEKSQMYGMGAKDVIEKMLPVLDSFERGFEGLPEDEEKTPFAEGMEKTEKQFRQALEALGVEPIKALGEPFNPELHNAVMHVDDENEGENIIVEEFQKGYTYNGQVVRFSMVKVAN